MAPQNGGMPGDGRPGGSAAGPAAIGRAQPTRQAALLEILGKYAAAIEAAQKEGDLARADELRKQLDKYHAHQRQTQQRQMALQHEQQMKQQKNISQAPGPGPTGPQQSATGSEVSQPQQRHIQMQQHKPQLHPTQQRMQAKKEQQQIGDAHLQQGQAVQKSQQPGAQDRDGTPGGHGAVAGGPSVRPGGVVGPTPPRPNRAQTLNLKISEMQNSVKAALDNSKRLEARKDMDLKRAKNERIQNTLTALRNSNSASVVNVNVDGKIVPSDAPGSKKEKRPFSLVDVDNSAVGSVISTKNVFECSAEVGLRLAKRQKNETTDLKALRDAVEADCLAASRRHPSMHLEIVKEYGLPIVTCQLLIDDIRLPKMTLRVQRGYPRKGGAAYGFERPPLGWTGTVAEIRRRFSSAIEIAPSSSVGVAAYLDAWAQEASAVCEESSALVDAELARFELSLVDGRCADDDFGDGSGDAGFDARGAGGVADDDSNMVDAAGVESSGLTGEGAGDVNLPLDFAAAAQAPIIAL